MASKDYKKLTEQYSTPEGTTRRSRERRAKLAAAFVAAGWKSESEYFTALLNGTIEAPQNPATAPRAQKVSE